VLGAMVGYAISYHTGSPWLGVLARLFGHRARRDPRLCLQAARVNDVAIGISMMLFGTGMAFFFGKPYIQPSAPRLSSIPLGDWTGNRSSPGAAGQSAVLSRHRHRLSDVVGLSQHALGLIVRMTA